MRPDFASRTIALANIFDRGPRASVLSLVISTPNVPPCTIRNPVEESEPYVPLLVKLARRLMQIVIVMEAMSRSNEGVFAEANIVSTIDNVGFFINRKCQGKWQWVSCQ